MYACRRILQNLGGRSQLFALLTKWATEKRREEKKRPHATTTPTLSFFGQNSRCFCCGCVTVFLLLLLLLLLLFFFFRWCSFTLSLSLFPSRFLLRERAFFLKLFGNKRTTHLTQSVVVVVVLSCFVIIVMLVLVCRILSINKTTTNKTKK